MTLYAALTPATDLVVATYGAAEGTGTSVGSLEDFKLIPGREVSFATHGAYRGARTDAAAHHPVVGIEFVVDNATKENIARAIGGVVSTDDIIGGCGLFGSLTTYTLYVRGMVIDGTARGIQLHKVVFTDPSEWAPTYEQTKWTVTAEALYDESASAGTEYYTTYATATDTTAPTVSTYSPANGASGVDASSTTTVIFTMSEPIKADDATASFFFVHNASGSIKDGTLAINASANAVTFTPTCGWAASTLHTAICMKGVRDLAGNKKTTTCAVTWTTA